MNYKQIMIDIYKKNMKGYSSENAHKYIKNKGIEPYVKYAFDKNHEFMALAGKGSVTVNVYYKGEIIDRDSYFKRYNLI